MKLYATTTSEKASKGQGGNKHLTIDLLVGSRDNQLDAGRVTMKTCGNGIFWIEYFAPHTAGQSVERIELLHIEDGIIQKGKKKKDECTSQFFSKTCTGCEYCKREIDQD